MQSLLLKLVTNVAILLVIYWVFWPSWGIGQPVKKIRVVTTTPDLKALVEAVGGDRLEVESIAPGDKDPHDLEIRPSHLVKLKGAELFVRIGLDHEPWAPRLLQRAASPHLFPGGEGHLDASRDVQLLETEVPRAGRAPGHIHGFGNTHYWLDPANARPITANILKTLSRLSPGDADRFSQNRATFLDRLDRALERWLRETAPYRGTPVVSYHNSWPYFAKRFGVEIVGFVEPNPSVPPSPAYIGSLTERMVKRQVKIIVMEPYFSDSVPRFLAEKTKAVIVKLSPSVGGAEGIVDYIALFDYNISRLVNAFGEAGIPRRRESGR
jgi:ABC-type Zn uptake system ZnuABC Zn-binding protein ZnuA